MKTKHVIAIGLLSATAIGLLAYGLHKSNKKIPLQTKADYKYIEFGNSDVEENIYYHISGNSNVTYNNDINSNWAIAYYKYNIEYNPYKDEQQNNKYTLTIRIKIEKYENEYTEQTFSSPTEIEYTENYDISKQLMGISFQSIKFTTTDYWNNEYQEDMRIENQIRISAEFKENNITTTQILTTNYLVQNLNNPTALYTPSTNPIKQIDKVTGLQSTMYNIYDFAQSEYNYGYEIGYGQGIQETNAEEAYNNGYILGYEDGNRANDIIDIRSVMLQILTMPFTFITQAFDVTIFPNTPYEFNFSRMIMGILAIATILFIIKMFTSGLSIIGNYTTNINKEAKMRSDNRKSKQTWKSQRIVEKGAKNANKE